MGADTPVEGKVEIMVLCGQLIGPKQHEAPAKEQISLTLPGLQGQRVPSREMDHF